MKIRAYCKINLALDVLKEREDGYHELKMIMVPVSFYDEIIIEKSEKPDYFCDKPYIYFDENNTIIKALNLMKKEFNIRDEFKIELKKSIPMKAGLAGGSSDGAAIIKAINAMYHLNLSSDRIRELCMAIGSDVLFTYYNAPALVEGLGDRLTFISIKEDYHVLIVKPHNGVSTKECYRTLDMASCIHPDVDAIREKLAKGEEVRDMLANSLEAPAISLCEDIARAREELLSAGASFAMVSGSGSAVFTMDKSEKKISALCRKMRGKGYFLRTCKILK